MTLTPKQFYVAERNPGFADRREFQDNWRGHGRLAMEQPLWANIFRYTQGDSLDLSAQTRSRLPGHDSVADGISTIWFHSFEAVLAIADAPEHPILLEDEDRIFAEMVASVSIFTAEDTLFEDSQPPEFEALLDQMVPFASVERSLATTELLPDGGAE
jgi:hypothetical protein